MISARPPNAAAGSPPDITLPKQYRSPATPSRPYQPARRDAEAGHHLVDDEQRAVRGAQPLEPGVEPVGGATAPMFPAAASVITQAISGPRSANTAATASRSL